MGTVFQDHRRILFTDKMQQGTTNSDLLCNTDIYAWLLNGNVLDFSASVQQCTAALCHGNPTTSALSPVENIEVSYVL
jgi:hypothetical protein